MQNGEFRAADALYEILQQSGRLLVGLVGCSGNDDAACGFALIYQRDMRRGCLRKEYNNQGENYLFHKGIKDISRRSGLSQKS